MKKSLLIMLLGMVVNSYAISYLNMVVNGIPGNNMTQGEMLAWDFDVATPGNVVNCEMYLDLNGDQMISEGDHLLGTFTLQDGGPGNDGPSDSSSVPDGYVFVNFGPFGFAPQTYLIRITDTDNTSQYNWLTIDGLNQPAATISGTVMFEDMSLPNPQIRNIMVMAMGDGLFSGLTDANGNYTINLPVADQSWFVDLPFGFNLAGYVGPADEYFINVPAGNTSGIDFHYSLAGATVYGTVRDETGAQMEISGYARLEGEMTSSEVQIVNGVYSIPVAFGANQNSGNFNLSVSSDMFQPNYLQPYGVGPIWIDFGDSLAQDITVYSTDAVIYGEITQNGEAPAGSYEFNAGGNMYGSATAMNNPGSSDFVINVRSGDNYYININDNPEWGTPLPPGYVVENGNYRMAAAGDTVRFNMVPAGNLIKGRLLFDPDDPTDYSQNDFSINAQDSLWNNYNTMPGADMYYELPVLDGRYNVSVWNNNGDFLSMPSIWPDVTVAQDTAEGINFEMNYAHAWIKIKLINAPIQEWNNYYNANTTGEWPWVYNANAHIEADSSFNLRVCEGDWQISAPLYHPDYIISLNDTLLHVTEADSFYYVEFRYQNITTIGGELQIPDSYFLEQNYPNPFNPGTTIRYGLARSGKTEVTVYNALGEKIATLVNAGQTAGEHSVIWQAGNMASGIYYYRIRSGSYTETRKMILIR
jgi:hypothetical protein